VEAAPTTIHSRHLFVNATIAASRVLDSTPQYVVERKDGKTGGHRALRARVVAIVVGVDILFFRNRFWERLMVNVGIVLVFGAFYLRFLSEGIDR
jgi:type IV secretory pathway VirB2 component (pilin)